MQNSNRYPYLLTNNTEGMNTDKKHRTLIWAIVILAVMNISTLSTIGYHVYLSNKAQEQTPTSQKQLETDAVKFSGQYFRDQLGFSSSQMDEFRDFNRPFRQQTHAITEELANKRTQMLSEMTAATSDTAKLNQLSEEIGILHSNLKKLTFQYYVNIKSISSPEQQQKLEKLFKDLFINDQSLQGPGRGMQRGWRHRQN